MDNFEKYTREFVDAQIRYIKRPYTVRDKPPAGSVLSTNVVKAINRSVNLNRQKLIELHFNEQSKSAVVEQLVELERMKLRREKEREDKVRGHTISVDFRKFNFTNQLPNEWPDDNADPDKVEEYATLISQVKSMEMVLYRLVSRLEHYDNLLDRLEDIQNTGIKDNNYKEFLTNMNNIPKDLKIKKYTQPDHLSLF